MASSTEHARETRERWAAAGRCRQCGAQLAELGGKMVCSVPCRARWYTLIAYASCILCREQFIVRVQGHNNCRKPECQRKMAVMRNKRHTPSEGAKARARERTRAHNNVRRVSVSDITPEQEAGMRKRAKDCPLCGVRMTDEPYLPNSKQLDHIVPVNQGGTHTHGNTRIICCSCNVKRPWDGSDYTGQLTLWAQEPGWAGRPRRWGGYRNGETCRKGLHPWPESAVTLWGQKQCGPCLEANRGAGYIARIGTRRKRIRGTAARLETARQVLEMQRAGMSLRAIARQLGYRDSKPVRNMLAELAAAGGHA